MNDHMERMTYQIVGDNQNSNKSDGDRGAG